MSREDAFTQAQAEATRRGHPMQVWEHVGGKRPDGSMITASGRFLVRDPAKRAPRYAWALVETVEPLS